jgi:adiponectin receptor
MWSSRIWSRNWFVEMKLLKLSSLPDWYRDNDYIKTGYRPPKESFKHCLKSLFSIHNETANIYSHLLGALLFVILWIYTFNYPLYQKFGLIDKLVFSSFFIGIITCLLISASFHTFNCHSRDIFKLFAKYWKTKFSLIDSLILVFILRLDYCGISLLIILSFVPWVYYGFYYSVIPRIIYLSLTALLGIACIVVSIFDRFSDPQYRKLRAILFICDGLSGK